MSTENIILLVIILLFAGWFVFNLFKAACYVFRGADDSEDFP